MVRYFYGCALVHISGGEFIEEIWLWVNDEFG